MSMRENLIYHNTPGLHSGRILMRSMSVGLKNLEFPHSERMRLGNLLLLTHHFVRNNSFDQQQEVSRQNASPASCDIVRI